MTAATMSAADVLRRAKQVLIERGWQPRPAAWGSRTGPCCALNAVAAATDDESCKRVVDRLLAKAIDEPWVHDWNDRQTSADPVLAAFDRAIELAEAER
jgi:hypothetical protein